MEENYSDIGLKLLEVLMKRRYSSSTIDNVGGAIAFSSNKLMTKTKLLSFLEENPNATEKEVNRKVSDLAKEYPRKRND